MSVEDELESVEEQELRKWRCWVEETFSKSLALKRTEYEVGNATKCGLEDN